MLAHDAQYNGARAPPKHLVFADNVIVQIAGTRFAPFSIHHDENADNLALIQEWLNHSKAVYLWNGINGGILPHGDCTAQALQIKELSELGVTGYFAEGDTWPGADCIELRVFLAARMTFDATLDIDRLVEEFLESYCESFIESFSHLVTSKATQSCVHVICFLVKSLFCGNDLFASCCCEL